MKPRPLLKLFQKRLHRAPAVLYYQWRSSAPKSGGAQTFFQKSEKQKKKKKKKVTAVFKRMIGYCE